MNKEERAILIWSIFFVISGAVFILALAITPIIGTMVTFSFIVMYTGLSVVFVLVFREIESVRRDSRDKLIDEIEEIHELKKAVKNKYFSKKIGLLAFKDIMNDYEKKLTEIEVKMKRLEKKKFE